MASKLLFRYGPCCDLIDLIYQKNIKAQWPTQISITVEYIYTHIHINDYYIHISYTSDSDYIFQTDQP